MANIWRGEAERKVSTREGEKTLTFCLMLNEVAELQTALGCEDMDLGEFFSRRLARLKKASDAITLCRIMLKRKHPEITDDEAGFIVTQIGIRPFFDDLVDDLLKWVLPEKRDVPGDASGKGGSASPGPTS